MTLHGKWIPTPYLPGAASRLHASHHHWHPDCFPSPPPRDASHVPRSTPTPYPFPPFPFPLLATLAPDHPSPLTTPRP